MNRDDSTPILDRLAWARVFELEPTTDGRFEITEGADWHFRVCLTADELRALGHELIALADVVPKNAIDVTDPSPN